MIKIGIQKHRANGGADGGTISITVTGHNGHKPKGHNRNGHKPKRPQTRRATNRNGRKPKRPQTGTATNRNGHRPKKATSRNGRRPKRPQTEKSKKKPATNRKGQTRWYSNILQGTCMTSGLQNTYVNNAWLLVAYSGMWKCLHRCDIYLLCNMGLIIWEWLRLLQPSGVTEKSTIPVWIT